MKILMASPATMSIMKMVQAAPRKLQYIQGKRCLQLMTGALATYSKENHAEYGFAKAVVDVIRAAREVIIERSNEKTDIMKLARSKKAKTTDQNSKKTNDI
jgi:hypothetical protein